MITLKELEELGVNTAEGLNRCMNKEDFYFKMIKMGLNNEYFAKLEEELLAGDLESAFNSAHALKGVLGNLALTPLYEPLADITEKLRKKAAADYVALYKPVKELRDKMTVMCV